MVCTNFPTIRMLLQLTYFWKQALIKIGSGLTNLVFYNNAFITGEWISYPIELGLSRVQKEYDMNLIIGGGKYGCHAVEFLRKMGEHFVIVDKDANCLAANKFQLKSPSKNDNEGDFIIQGGIEKSLELVEALNPEYVFPTAPIHIAAELARVKFKLSSWPEAIDNILSKLPPKVILRAGRGNLIVSYNRDHDCREKCVVPEMCPSTKTIKPCTMDKLMRFACPESYILISHLLAPGMGAFRGSELLDFFDWAEKKDRFIIATACDCHGCFSAFKKT